MRNFVVSLLIVISIFTFNQSACAEAVAGFTLKDTAGIQHQLSSYKGKWVIVNYWATWCPPCLEEVPDLVKLFESRNKKDLMVIGVVFDYESIAAVNAYVNEQLITYPIVLGDDAVTAQIGVADVLPTTFIYNPKGELLKIKRGLVTKQYIEKIIGQNKR